MGKPGFWDDQEKAQHTLRERARLQEELRKWGQKEAELEEILILADIARETEDPADLAELSARVDASFMAV